MTERLNWTRLLAYGAALWAVPFVVSVALFGVREGNRPLFESLIVVVGIVAAVCASLLYFRDRKSASLSEGLALGFAWAAISIIIDLPFFLAVFGMSLPEYVADIALTYLAFPAITSGIAVAKDNGRQREEEPRL